MTHRGDTSEAKARERRGFPLPDDFPTPRGLGELAAAHEHRDGDERARERRGDARDRGAAPRDRRAEVLDRIRATPPGFVRTYGDVSPGAPRFAGTVLSGGVPSDVPWFRIVRADGSIATHPPARQRELLESEGVPFRGEKVDMRAARLP